MKLSVNMAIDEYVLIKLIGQGGMGEVWLANQTEIDRKVALKILNSKLASNQKIVRRFIREAKNTGKLQHDNIITALDAGVTKDEIYYIVMSYVDGQDLDHIIENQGAFKEKKALKIANDIADALHYSWNNHMMIHRDVKPANIMIDKFEETKLMDMGIAKCLGDDTVALTMTGTIMGSPNYMSPEQAKGRPDVDFRADVFSLGTTLFHLVTGIPPFDDKKIANVISNVINEHIENPSKINPKVSKQCTQLIYKMTSKKPEDRYKSWETVMEDIELVKAGHSPKFAINPNIKNKLTRIKERTIELKTAKTSISMKLMIIFSVLIILLLIGYLIFNLELI